jgi:hypothetical protein
MTLTTSVTPDLAGWLPPNAADKMRALQQRSRDAHALIPPSVDRLDAANARIEAEQRLARLTNHHSERGGGFNMKPDDPTVLAAKKLLDELTAAKARIEQRYNERTAEWTAKSQPLSNVETWLKTGKPHGTVLEDFDGPDPQLLKGEDLMTGISRLQRRGRELKADLHRVRSAPYPSSHCKAQARAQVSALAARGAPVVSDVVENDRQIIWPTTRVKVDVLNAGPGAIGFIEIPDMLAIDAWRNKDALIAALDREIAAESDDAAALSHEARKKAEAEVMGDLLDIEYREAALVWSAQEQRLPIEHRGDCSPLAILGVVLVTKSVNPSPETSPGYSYTVSGQASAQRQRVAARKVDKPPPPLG